jgi:hypothetical protein
VLVWEGREGVGGSEREVGREGGREGKTDLAQIGLGADEDERDTGSVVLYFRVPRQGETEGGREGGGRMTYSSSFPL